MRWKGFFFSRPGADTTDSLVCAAGLPISGTAPPMVQPESRTALLTCLGRQMGAHPPAADEARAYAVGKTAGEPGRRRVGFPEPCTRQANLLSQRSHKSDLWSSTCARCAGGLRFWPNEPSGPKRKICGAIDSDFLTENDGTGG